MPSGKVYKYGDNVDTDVIIPARYLNAPSPDELAKHCMEDIDATFAHFLPQRHQHWFSDSGMPRSGGGDCKRRPSVG